MGEFHSREDDLEICLPVILKFVVLTLLFFVAIEWIYFALSAISPYWFITEDPRWPAEMRQEEIARASNLGSFLANLFLGNFGISFRTMRPVSEELAWRSVNTCLLVGLPIVFSVVIGMGLSFLFEFGKRKPSTFAHSLRGFFFGWVPVIGLPSILVFSYYAYAVLGFPLFPYGRLHSVPPPTDPLAYICDVQSHLFLPVATLTLIGVIRILLVIWSSGSTFTKRTLLKKILLPCTTFDFTVMISAVVLVEYVFTLPGIGNWFIESLYQGDYNALVGAFVMFLVLAVGLGYVSVILDFIQRMTGLREDLERKVPTEPEINPTQTKEDIKKYVKLFLRRKALVIGSAIVIVFLMLAVFAPFITPYDPIGAESVADGFAMPAWVTVLPQNKGLPRTMELPLNWTLEEESAVINVMESGEDLAVQFGGAETGTKSINFTAYFMYPYSAPKKFSVYFTWRTGNITNAEYSLALFIVNPDEERFIFWTTYQHLPAFEFSSKTVNLTYVTQYSTALPGYILERLNIERGANIAEQIFVKPGEYKLELQMRFRPKSPDGTAEIHFADAKLKILGLIHGILGCDSLGRDIFAQVVYGARSAVILAFPTALLVIILSSPFGFLAGYFQGWVDNFITPVADALLCPPILLILLVNIVLFGTSLYVFLLTLLLFLSPLAVKAFRNTFLVRASNQKFKGNTLTKQGLNIIKDLVTNFCLTAMSLMLLLWSINFIGLGDPTVPSWGRMLHYAHSMGGFFHLAWWWILPPMVCIALFALGLLLVGAGLEGESS